MTNKTIAELREWLEEAKKNGDARFYNEFKAAEKIISRAEAEQGERKVYHDVEKFFEDDPTPTKPMEPLAVLANSNGFSMRIGSNEKGVWFISLRKGHNTREQISADTYAAAEAKARAYLEGLEDVTKEGR